MTNTSDTRVRNLQKSNEDDSAGNPNAKSPPAREDFYGKDKEYLKDPQKRPEQRAADEATQLPEGSKAPYRSHTDNKDLIVDANDPSTFTPPYSPDRRPGQPWDMVSADTGPLPHRKDEFPEAKQDKDHKPDVTDRERELVRNRADVRIPGEPAGKQQPTPKEPGEHHTPSSNRRDNKADKDD